MIVSNTGEWAALGTTVCWTVTTLAFERASRAVGSLAVNWIRLIMAMIFISLFTWASRGLFFPVDATPHAWLWLSLSGLVGFVLGDLFLFRSYLEVTARIAMLIMTLVPPMTALAGWMFLGETLTFIQLTGMALTLSGIAIVVLKRPGTEGGKLDFHYSVKGILLAFGGAVGQAAGLILSKIGMGTYDPFASTQIRIITGIAGFTLIVTVLKRWNSVGAAIRQAPAMGAMATGAFFGPFIGVSLSLLAVQTTHAGVAATIMSAVPVLIIIPSVFLLKEKVNGREMIGAAISVAGIALLFI